VTVGAGPERGQEFGARRRAIWLQEQIFHDLSFSAANPFDLSLADRSFETTEHPHDQKRRLVEGGCLSRSGFDVELARDAIRTIRAIGIRNEKSPFFQEREPIAILRQIRTAQGRAKRLDIGGSRFV
jgi:hypothetical protein